MRSSACLLRMVSIFSFLIASWAAQAQATVPRTAEVLIMPGGISATGNVATFLPGPAGTSAAPSSGLLTLPDQFTLGAVRSSTDSAGENLSTDKSCLTAKAYVRPDLVNKILHQNWVMARNGCGHLIQISVCTSGTANCVPISVPPWQTKNAIIGYAPNGSEVHYQIISRASGAGHNLGPAVQSGAE